MHLALTAICGRSMSTVTWLVACCLPLKDVMHDAAHEPACKTWMGGGGRGNVVCMAVTV